MRKINDTLPHLLLKILRRIIYPYFFKSYSLPFLRMEESLDTANRLIFDKLMDKNPCMIARYGEFEISTVVNYLFISNRYPHNTIDYIKGKGWEWWWNETTLANMKNNAGVWPNDHVTIERYCKLVVEDSKQVDIIGSITGLEIYLEEELKNAIKIPLFNLEPFFSKNPWTKALEGKRVLVIHPFVNTIEKQYLEFRTKLFENQDILPEFELMTMPAVQSNGGSDEFDDWFHALDYMKKKVDTINFDIAILGCGAYGFNLAAHIKRIGKKAIHLGGVTQILFGIRGRRWEQPNQKWYVNGAYPDLMNKYWRRPVFDEKIKNASNIEGACYW